MPVEIRVPALGESIVEATVARWMKREGEPVSAGEPVVELETEKVNVEVPAPEAGVLARIDRQEGETVAVGDALASVDPSGAATASAAATPPAAAELQLSETAPVSPGTGAAASAPVSAGTGPAATAPAKGGPNGAETGDHRAEPLVSPLARRFAADKHLDLRQVKGSGPGGRIMKEDIATSIERTADAPATAQTLAQEASARPAAAAPSAPARPEARPGGAGTAPPAQAPTAPPQAAPPSPVSASPSAAVAAPAARAEERVRMTRRRQTIARRLVEAQHTAAMLTTFNEIDMTAVMEVRKRRRESFRERHGVGLGFMSFFTKATIGALKAYPYLNAEIQGDEVLVKRYYDIGVAVSTEEGLVVPVVRDADRKSFAEIEREIADLATRARDGKLTIPDLQGGTFTITNGGVFGSLMSTPILNAPQVGILGMHKIEERPVVRDGQVAIRPMMYVALSYDHRIVDGSEAVRFLVRVKELIEDPESLLLEG